MTSQSRLGNLSASRLPSVSNLSASRLGNLSASRLPSVGNPYASRLGNPATPFALSEFSWCQILYLYARELNLAGSGWESALQEANTLVGILQEKRNALTYLPGTSSNTHVYWPDLICAANIYARLPVEVRAEALTKLYDDAHPLPTVHIGLTDFACERRAQVDEEYIPEPPCLPSEPVKGAWIGAGMFVIVSSAMLLHKAIR